jgi:hypothetical protein
MPVEGSLPTLQGVRVIPSPPGAAVRIGSTPANNVTAELCADCSDGDVATIITASPGFSPATVSVGNRDNICERSMPARRAPATVPC